MSSPRASVNPVRLLLAAGDPLSFLFADGGPLGFPLADGESLSFPLVTGDPRVVFWPLEVFLVYSGCWRYTEPPSWR